MKITYLKFYSNLPGNRLTPGDTYVPVDRATIDAGNALSRHDDVIKWKHFPRYWSFVGIPAQRPVTRSFDVFFDLRLNKRLSKQSRGWWFETPSRPLWRHRNVVPSHYQVIGKINGEIGSIGPSVTIFTETWVKTIKLNFKKMHLKISSSNVRQSCLWLRVF